MSDWFANIAHSLAEQAGTWFIGLVVALLGLVSGRLVENIKFALNRADLRTKYYEELAEELSNIVFIVDRLVKVYYGSRWASDEDRTAIAIAYNESMNKISRKEYVYLSWLRRYWGKKAANAFVLAMQSIRAVDGVLIRLNDLNVLKDQAGKESAMADLESAFRGLQVAVQSVLVPTI